jgi:hypothetical protein
LDDASHALHSISIDTECLFAKYNWMEHSSCMAQKPVDRSPVVS